MMLKDKICLVVGASSGMGRRTAYLAGEQGATVIVAARRKAECDEVAEGIVKNGGSAMSLPFDACDEAAVEAAFATITDRYGRLDCAFNNLGAMQGFTLLHETPVEMWDAALSINLTSVFLLMRQEIPLLRAAKGGAIVNNSSTAGITGLASVSNYCAAKWGLIGLTQSAAIEYGKDNIRCVAIAPGIIMTEKAEEMRAAAPDQFAPLLATIPMGKTGEMQDVAELVCWLMSDAAKYISGVTIPIDGARTA